MTIWMRETVTITIRVHDMSRLQCDDCDAREINVVENEIYLL